LNSFLRVVKNKKELFGLLAQEKGSIDVVDKEVYSTDDNRIVSSTARERLEGLQPCNHEEANTRIFFLVYNFLAMLLYPKQLRKVSCFYQKNAQFPEIFGLNC